VRGFLAGEVIGMRASVGDRLHVHAKTVGHEDRFGEMVVPSGQTGTGDS